MVAWTETGELGSVVLEEAVTAVGQPIAQPPKEQPAWKAMMQGSMGAGLPLRMMPLYVFLHIPKTAGTSARQMWRWMTNDFYFAYNHEVHHPGPGETPRWEQPGFFDRLLMIGGHFDLGHPIVRTARRTGRRIVFVGVLREPVARVVSLYDFVRRQPQHPLAAELRTITLLEAIERPGAFARAFASNAQLLQLFGSAEPDAIEQALRRDSYILGRQDQLEALFDAFASLSGLPRPQRNPRANVAEEPRDPAIRPAREQPGFAAACARIGELNTAEANFLAQRLPRLLVTQPGVIAPT